MQWLEEVTGFEKRNKYKIYPKPAGVDAAGADQFIKQNPHIWDAKEKSECCERQFCKPMHEFHMEIKDVNHHEVLEYHRPFKCTMYCWCTILCPQRIECKLKTGQELGFVEQKFKCCSFAHWFDVFITGQEHPVYELRVGCCQCGPNMCCQRWTCDILRHGSEDIVGSICNLWPGCNIRGLCSKADNLEINFDQPMPPDHKAVLIGAVFLIDFMYFERPGGGNDAIQS